MDKIEEAREILQLLDMPDKQQTDMCCYAFLAMAGIAPKAEWQQATNEWVRIHDILSFTRKYYQDYAENSRETFRKQAIAHFRNAALIETNNLPTNSPNYRYRITNETLELIKSYNTLSWSLNLKNFKDHHGTLIDLYESKKMMMKMPVNINGLDFTFSTGSHNLLQKSILEEFAPRFAPNSECLYVGDTTNKDLVKNTDKMAQLGFEITLHDKMPDVILYNEENDWIYFIEAVTSVGPIDPKRVLEIEAMTQNVRSGKIYITAFLAFDTYKKFSQNLAWETEVWIAELPDHMIHLNGNKFIGPRK